MTSTNKSSRAVALFVASVVAAATTVLVANAGTTLTVANAASIAYNLAPGANSVAITPAANVPVMVMGTQTAVGYRGVGHVTLLRPSVAPLFIEWTGLESPAGAAITSGFSAVAGTHIVYLDYSHTVDIEVNSATSIRVHNGNTVQMTGNVTLIW